MFDFHLENCGRWTHFDYFWLISFSDGLVQPPTRYQSQLNDTKLWFRHNYSFHPEAWEKGNPLNTFKSIIFSALFPQEHVVHWVVWGCRLKIMGLFIQGVFEDLRCLLFKRCGWLSSSHVTGYSGWLRTSKRKRLYRYFYFSGSKR